MGFSIELFVCQLNCLVDKCGLGGGPHELGVERLVTPHQVPLEVVRRLVVGAAEVLLARVAGGRAPVLRCEVLPYGQCWKLRCIVVFSILFQLVKAVALLALGGNSIGS